MKNVRIIKKDDEFVIKVTEENRQFVLDWYKELSWHNNPFTPKILEPVEEFISGYNDERQKLNLFVIEKHQFGIIAGEPGTGKTMLLKWLCYELKKYKDRIITNIINGTKSERTFLKELVHPLLGWHEKFLFKPHKKLNIDNISDFIKKKLGYSKSYVVMIDNAQDLSKQNVFILKQMSELKIPIQIIICGEKKAIDASDCSLFKFKDDLKINLKGIDEDSALQMLKYRIERFGGKETEPFDGFIFNKMYKKCENNPLKLLELSYKEAVNISLKRVQEKDKKDDSVFEQKEAPKKEEAKKDSVKEEKPAKTSDSIIDQNASLVDDLVDEFKRRKG